MTRPQLPRPERPSLDEHCDRSSLARAQSSLSANPERHLAVTERRSLRLYARVHVMRIARAKILRRSFTLVFGSKLSQRVEETSAGPSFTRIRAPRFSDAAPMARFSNLSIAGPTATHRLLQHKPTYGHDYRAADPRFACRGQDPNSPAPVHAPNSLSRPSERPSARSEHRVHVRRA